MYYVNPNIKSLYRTSYTESRESFIRLDMNENPEGLPPHFFEEIMSSITPEFVSMYPDMTSLINKLSSYLHCAPTNICLTNGSDDAIRLLFEVFGEPGKKVVSVSPSFEMYSVYMKMYGMIHSPVVFNENFDVSLDNILKAIDLETSIVVLLNPNSPIGNEWSEEEVRVIIEKAKDNNAIVVIDEAYFYFSPFTLVNVFNEYDNVMIFRTFSKLLSIAGCRIGYIVSNEEIIGLSKRACSTYPVNCFAIKFAEKIMENPQIIAHLIETERKGREYLLSQLKENNYEYYYNHGNYVLIKSNKSPQQVFEELKAKRILVKTYSTPILSNWIRITTGSIEVMNTFWETFLEIDQL